MTTYVNPNIPYPEFGKFENIWTDTRLIDDLVTSATSMATGSLTIGDTSKSFGGGNNWNTNTAGLLMECFDNTEIAVHDNVTRIASFMYYTVGTNELVGTNPNAIKPAMEKLFSGNWKKGAIPELWDGKSAERIISNLLKIFSVDK